MSVKRDLYSHLGFFQAIKPQVAAAAVTGETIDLRSYNGAIIAVQFASLTSALSAVGDSLKFVLQHDEASALGNIGNWSLVPGSLILHSVMGGLGSTSETGLFQSVNKSTASGIFYVGYKGDATHRYLRVYVSVSGAAPSAGVVVAADAVLGLPNLWPVNTAIN